MTDTCDCDGCREWRAIRAGFVAEAHQTTGERVAAEERNRRLDETRGEPELPYRTVA